VVVYQHKSVRRRAEPSRQFRDHAQESPPILVRPVDRLPAVAPGLTPLLTSVHDVVDRAWKLDSQLARHPRHRAGGDTGCSLPGLTRMVLETLAEAPKEGLKIREERCVHGVKLWGGRTTAPMDT
jgi:hypothetical protein